MPIFMPSFEEDQEFILRLARRVCNYWNNNGGVEHGVRLFVAKQAVDLVSRGGDEVLAAFFADEPGPFKRLAALLVLARLAPLFTLATPDSTREDPQPIPSEIEQEWLPRVCFLLIEPVLSNLAVKDAQGKLTSLSHWDGFPSLHSKAEFLLWLEWMRDYAAEHLIADENIVRRGRMMLATSLILEAVYYQNPEARKTVCGFCDNNVGNLTGVVFDGLLRMKKLEREAKS